MNRQHTEIYHIRFCVTFPVIIRPVRLSDTASAYYLCAFAPFTYYLYTNPLFMPSPPEPRRRPDAVGVAKDRCRECDDGFEQRLFNVSFEAWSQ
ncbi:hypothetical protein EVAR_28089_1 [Eumeta japonica]|uniref:Uncharacterized protein n=1 Tax=Eumeta variegata TaxID=151549 RepID=A0A4C1W8I2_EUMVA|nr:hypothetical protein EVAR_28089_1 [Eumeta japonica]